MKGRKKKKSRAPRIAAIIMIVVIAVLALCAVFLATRGDSSAGGQFKQFFESFLGSKNKKTLSEEADKIVSLDPYTDELDNSIYTTGTFAVLESAVKGVCTEYIGELRTVRNLLSDENYKNILSVENMQTDGPAFTASFELLDTLQAQAEASVQHLKEMGTEEALMQPVEGAGLNTYFEDLYRETMLDKIAARWMYPDSELDEALQSLTASIESRRGVLEFLRDESENWLISEGKLAFTNEELLEQYNEKINDLHG